MKTFIKGFSFLLAASGLTIMGISFICDSPLLFGWAALMFFTGGLVAAVVNN